MSSKTKTYDLDNILNTLIHNHFPELNGCDIWLEVGKYDCPIDVGELTEEGFYIELDEKLSKKKFVCGAIAFQLSKIILSDYYNLKHKLLHRVSKSYKSLFYRNATILVLLRGLGETLALYNKWLSNNYEVDEEDGILSDLNMSAASIIDAISAKDIAANILKKDKFILSDKVKLFENAPNNSFGALFPMLFGHYFLLIGKDNTKYPLGARYGLVAHELSHIEQIENIGISKVLYRHSKKYRVLVERDADFRVVMRGYGEGLISLYKASREENDHFSDSGLHPREIERLISLSSNT